MIDFALAAIAEYVDAVDVALPTPIAATDGADGPELRDLMRELATSRAWCNGRWCGGPARLVGGPLRRRYRRRS